MKKPVINFTPGPSQLYFTVADHMKAAFREGIPSLSHRSKKFSAIYKETVEGLQALLNVPTHYQMFFTGSATEIWERAVENLVEKNSFHLVNGSFSKRFFEIAQQLNKNPAKVETGAGLGFETVPVLPSGVELIAVTQNETSTGVSTPLTVIHELKKANPAALLVVDAVSSLPYPDFNYNEIDSVFFSVQKGFGLPAGLGVWLVNDKCIARSEQLLSKGISIGSYHSIPSLLANAKNYQTPETPNVLGIYLLGKVVADMVRRGIHSIRKETEYKSALLYHALEKHANVKPFVKDKNLQSRTVIVADTGQHTERIVNSLQEKGMFPGDGYGASKKSQLRFANFPTHSKEHFELLVDSLEKI